MSDRTDLYPSSSVSISTSPLRVADSGEISLGEELDSLLTGSGGDVPKGRVFILRRLRRDSNDVPTQCVCVSEGPYKQAEHDYPCPYCLGTGFLFDEISFVAYKVIVTSASGSGVAKGGLVKQEFGNMEEAEVKFYLKHTTVPKVRDRIVEIEYDVEGNIVSPLNRTTIYEVAVVRPMAGDNGRVEYFTVHVFRNYQGTEGTVG